MTEWKDAEALTALAAAYAETGNFELAVKWQGKALELLTQDEAGRGAYQERLKLYQEKKPYREVTPGS